MRKNSRVTNLKEYRKQKLNTNYNDKNSYNKKKIKNKKKLRPIFILVLFIVCIILLFMYRYSVISNLKYEIQSLNKNLESIKNNKKELYLELENLSKSDFIEKTAKEKLNMDYPKDEQIVYIKLD